ncbi:MAG: LysR family transcriptional regulator, partial [SAR324 cluster bacterium]|nr:LysR family transcriptional regulator [SAR324 cluster bacterium]
MEMHQVRYFLAVCEARNFTRAAELCHVSQPSLTNAIKKLEEELGGPLFHRERNAVRPTALGDTLRPRLEQIQTEAQAALTDAHHFLNLDRVPLKVGVLLTIGPARISGFLSHFQHRFPGIEVEIHDGRQDDLMPRLRRNELDVAVINLLDPLDESFT